MNIETPAFAQGMPIPKKFTCQGEGISPELIFQNIPSNTQSLVLIVDDPDAPSGTFDHWIVWNIPANTKSLKEGVEGSAVAHQGKNGYGKLGYNGPCPPPGKVHRYFFKLYALAEELLLPKGATKAQVERAMEGHIIANAELIGTYQKN